MMTELQSASDKLDNKAEDKLVLENKDGVICNNTASEYIMGLKGDLNQAETLTSTAAPPHLTHHPPRRLFPGAPPAIFPPLPPPAAPFAPPSLLLPFPPLLLIANRIEQELEAVITSLQFGDLVAQLLVHTARQVEMLSDALRGIDRQGSLQGKAEKRALNSTHSSINKAVNEVKNKGKKKPVVQQGMKMGDIELF